MVEIRPRWGRKIKGDTLPRLPSPVSRLPSLVLRQTLAYSWVSLRFTHVRLLSPLRGSITLTFSCTVGYAYAYGVALTHG